MDRRNFMKRLGLGAGAIGGMSVLGIPSLMAAEGQAPKRLIILSHCHGWPYENWKMRPGGATSSTPWAKDLTSMDQSEFSAPLAPLFAHRKRILPIDGISLATAELDVDGNRHDTGWVQAWTGNWVNFSGSDTRSTSASLDQLVAAQIARSDRLPSIEFSVDGSGEGGRPISYAPTGSRLPVANTPQLAWQRLFGLTSNADPLALRQQQMLDYANAEYLALKPDLGASQKSRISDHFDLLSQLGARIQGLASLSCADSPTPVSGGSYDESFDSFSELIGAAFACDITRVATLSLGELPTEDFGWGDFSDDVHKGIAHGIYDSADKLQAMTDYIAMHGAQVARLISLLENLTDIDGRSVMDNTLIVWGSELADGWHGYRHWCPVIIGGDWHFRTGRYVHFPHEKPVQILAHPDQASGGYTETSGLPHQRMLVSVAQAMGLDTDHIGIESCQGQTGEHIECSGAIEELV